MRLQTILRIDFKLLKSSVIYVFVFYFKLTFLIV